MRGDGGNLSRLTGGVVAVVLTVLMTLLVAVPPAAAPPRTDGGSGGGGVFALAMAEGHVGGGSYPSCNWRHMWRNDLFSRILAVIRTMIALATGGIPPGTEQAELVLDVDAIETNVYLDGALAQLLGRDGSYVVSYEGEDVTLAQKVVVYLLGSHQVGAFNADDTADRGYDRHPDFPAIQRGRWSGGELWWDPYYIPADDPGDDECEPGWIYFPRDSDPLTLIPDLQDYMHRLLPEVIPELRPLDSEAGWAYVQVPLNFTTAASSLAEVSATARVFDPRSGPVWAEATAIPVRVVFDPGDGSDTVLCDVEDARAAFDADDPGFCSFTYLDSSNIAPGDVFPAVVGVEWQGVMVDSSGGPLVNFPIEPTYVEVDIAVAEARPAASVGD